MDESEVAGMVQGLAAVEDRLRQVETALAALTRGRATGGDADARMASLVQELAELRRANLLSGLQDVEAKLEQRVNLVRQVGDEWVALIAPVTRAGGLRGLNAGVEALGQRVQRLTIACGVLALLVVVLAVVTLAA